MPDEPLDPQTDERVRRLLAQARHDGPIPTDVAERMDRVLAGLSAEPATRGRVVRLADRRRRAATLLVAAAAVVLGGVGVSELVAHQGGLTSKSSDTAGAGAASAPEVDSLRNAPHAAAPSDATGRATGSNASELRRAFRIRPEEFSQDVQSARKSASLAFSADSATVDGAAGALPFPGCRVRAWGSGRFVPVRYGSSQGYLVFRAPVGDTQVADLFLCGSRDVVRSITLPRP